MYILDTPTFWHLLPQKRFVILVYLFIRGKLLRISTTMCFLRFIGGRMQCITRILDGTPSYLPCGQSKCNSPGEFGNGNREQEQEQVSFRFSLADSLFPTLSLDRGTVTVRPTRTVRARGSGDVGAPCSSFLSIFWASLFSLLLCFLFRGIRACAGCGLCQKISFRDKSLFAIGYLLAQARSLIVFNGNICFDSSYVSSFGCLVIFVFQWLPVNAGDFRFRDSEHN